MPCSATVPLVKFAKGQSGNPAGRPVRKGKAAPGSDGVVSYGGYITSGEGNSALTGSQKWITYANAINEAVIATGVRYFGNLLAGTEWHADPSPEGGADAARAVEIVEAGLLNNRLMPRPWPMVVRKAAMCRLMGYSLHATALARRPDGLVVFSDIAHRPQRTIIEWHRDDEAAPWRSVVQQTTSGKRYELELAECFYCVDDTLTDSPEGVGLLRHVIELVRRLGLYQALEGKAYFEDMGGLPIGRAPLEEIAEGVSGTVDQKRAAITAATASLTDAVSKRAKSPETQQWLMLDSRTYTGSNPDTISGIQKWGVELVKSETNGLPDINVVIGRLQLEIARVLGIEFAMVGGGDSAGTYGMHEDKTSMFASNLQTALTEIGGFATRQLARRLVAANGLDPDTCTPMLVAEPISTEAIETVTRSLGNIAMAALAPDDPARNVLRKRMRLPPEPDRSASVMVPRAPLPPAPVVAEPTKEPTP